jgi:hypothetical protein
MQDLHSLCTRDLAVLCLPGHEPREDACLVKCYTIAGGVDLNRTASWECLPQKRQCKSCECVEASHRCVSDRNPSSASLDELAGCLASEEGDSE